MGINSFYTTAIQTPNNGASTVAGVQTAGALGGSVTGTDTSGGALNFFDLFLARVQESLKAAQDKAQNTPDTLDTQKSTTALTSENPLLEKDTKLDLARLLANNETISDQAKKIAQATEDNDAFAQNVAAASASLALNEKSFEDIMKPIMESTASDEQKFDALQKLLRIETDKLNAESDKNTPALLDIIFGLMNNANGKNIGDAGSLENILALDNAADNAAHLTANLTPAEITALQKHTRQKDMEAIAALLARMDSAATKQSTQLASALNASDVGGSAGNANASIDAQTNGFKNFETILKQFTNDLRGTFTHADDGVTPAPQGSDLSSKASADKGDALPHGAHIKDKASTDSLALLAKNAGLSVNAAEAMGISEQFRKFIEGMGMGGQSTYTSPSMQALINPVMQSAQAYTPHPATQTMMITLQKSLNGGNENRNIMLELDPPELGRVEVRMNFSKDKSMKTSLLIEKPETYFLLQKDSHLLERTLQESGLDMDGGISFELASDDNNFFGDNRRGGGHDHGGQGASRDNKTIETIETTMTWRIDPQSGHTRYDIWA